MKKRWVALGLAVLLIISCLAGCGGNSNSGADTNAGSGSESDTEKTEGGETSSSEESKEEDSQNEEPVTVKWCVFGDKQPDQDKVLEDLNKKLVEKINVRLELEIIPQGEYNDKMRLMSTAGEAYDLVYTSNWINSFSDNISRDAFLPIDELFAQYGQDIAASIPDWLLDVGKIDGTLYAVPNQQIIARQLGVAIQKEYAEKYGFDKTSLKDITELEPFLDEIVKNEPTLFPVDKRVDAVYEKEYEGVVAISAPAGNNGDCVVLDKNSEELRVLPSSDALTDQLILDNEWYQKGYIRKDIATVVDNTADVKANRYVCTMSVYKPGWDAEFTARQGVEYITVPIEGAYVKAISGIETMTAINVNSQNPEAAMKLLNLVYTDKEIYNELLFGLEGEHYTKTGENSAEPISDESGSKYDLSSYAWKFGNQFNAWYLPGQEEGVWEQTDTLNNEAEVSILRGFTFDPTNVQSELAQIGAVVKEYANGQYTANDINAYIAERSDKMEQAGLSKVVEEVQSQIDQWMADK